MALRFLRDGYFVGKVGIGTASPGAKLNVAGDILIDSGEYLSWGTVGSTSIEGSTASNKLQFRTSSTDRMIINDTGVGIGTTNPSSKLTVSGPDAPSLDNGENSIRIERHASAAASPGELGNGINFAQKWWSGSAGLQVTGGIYGIKNGANGTYGGGLAFYTQPSSAADMAQRMIIDTAGAIQFNAYDSTNNTGTPTYLLGTDASGNIVKTNTIPGSAAGPYLPLSAGSSYPLSGDLYQTMGTIGVAQTDQDYIAKIYELNSDGFLSLYTGQPTPLEKVRISSYGNSWIDPANNGNLGIGTTSPGAKLEVFNSGGTVFNVTGSQGQLFSVTDNLSGSIFAVADISGVPILDVNSSGLVTVDGNLYLPDNKKILLGTGNDLQIYHDGSNSYIDDASGTGSLYINTNAFRLVSANKGENMIRAFEDGQVILSYNNLDRISTTSTGVTVTGALLTTDDITISNTSPELYLTNTNALKYNWMVAAQENVDQAFEITPSTAVGGSTYNAPALKIDGSTSNATFAAGVEALTVTANTFLGDLNGTINTVTTAVTKPNTTDDNTVATTAFVKNLIAELPAGLIYKGTWDADTNTPTLASGGGEISEGTTTTVTANKLIDSAATFTTDGVAAGDRARVENVNGVSYALVTSVDSQTQLTLDADIVVSTTEVYIIETPVFLEEGNYYIVSVDGAEDLNGITDWKVGDWVVASSTNEWQKIDNSSVLDGQGTGQTLSLWSGSGNSNTLTDSRFTQTSTENIITGPGNTAADYSLKVENAANTTSLYIQGTGEVVVGANYFYVAASQGAYINGILRARGGVTDDQGTLNLGGNGTTTNLTLTSNTSATFAGTLNSDNITVGKGDGNNSFISLTANTGNWTFTNVQASRNLEISDSDGTGVAMTIDTNANSTFAGSVTCVGLSSTIDSATSGYFATNTAIPGGQIVHVRDNVATTLVSSAGGIKISSSPGNDAFLLKRWDHSASASYFAVQNSSGSEFITTNLATGYVGIGTTSPDAKLEVAGGSTGIRLSNLGDSGAYDSIEMTYNGYNSGTPEMKFRPTQTPGSGIVNSYFRFINSNGSSTTSNNHANVTVDGNVGIGTTSPANKLHIDGTGGTPALRIDKGGDRIVYLGTGASTDVGGDDTILQLINEGVEKVRIFTEGDSWLNGGNVGIGTTTPDAKLEVAGGSTGIRLSNLGNSGAYDSIEMTYNGYNSGTPEMKFRPTQTPGSGIVNSYFRFINSNGSSTAANNHANVTVDGKVGIGTDSPSSKLQVDGGIQMGNDSDTAAAAKVGTMRYRTGTEYVEVDGVELVTNGDFASSSNWSVTGGWTISGGKANYATAVTSYLVQTSIPLTSGVVYRVRFNVSGSSGSGAFIWIGNQAGNTNYLGGTYKYYADGDFEEIFTMPSNQTTITFYSQTASSNFSFDNVTLMEVTAEDASYADMCMQTGASTYEWVNIVRNTY